MTRAGRDFATCAHRSERPPSATIHSPHGKRAPLERRLRRIDALGGADRSDRAAMATDIAGGADPADANRAPYPIANPVALGAHPLSRALFNHRRSGA